MKKSLFIFIVLLALSVIASILSMVLVMRPSSINQCNEEGICTEIGYPPRVGFPFSVNEASFDPAFMFVANIVFYFLIFSVFYFVYLMLFRKKKKK